jgi:hypothetical protein
MSRAAVIRVRLVRPSIMTSWQRSLGEIGQLISSGRTALMLAQCCVVVRVLGHCSGRAQRHQHASEFAVPLEHVASDKTRTAVSVMGAFDGQ